MAKCIDKKNGNCEFYFPKTGDCSAGCATDGDITNPEEDIYCGEVDGDNEKYYDKKVGK